MRYCVAGGAGFGIEEGDGDGVVVGSGVVVGAGASVAAGSGAAVTDARAGCAAPVTTPAMRASTAIPVAVERMDGRMG